MYVFSSVRRRRRLRRPRRRRSPHFVLLITPKLHNLSRWYRSCGHYSDGKFWWWGYRSAWLIPLWWTARVIDFACERDNSETADRISTKFCRGIDIGLALNYQQVSVMVEWILFQWRPFWFLWLCKFHSHASISLSISRIGLKFDVVTYRDLQEQS